MHRFLDVHKMNNGLTIPAIGFGTWRIPEGEMAYNSTKNALDVGFRHIDTAKVYQNEKSVGAAIKDSGIKREDIFLTTKLWNEDRGYDSTLYAFEESLKKLDTDYIDLYLMHWPAAKHQFDNWKEINIESFKAMKRLQQEGVLKTYGCSNFLEHHLKVLFDADIFPAVNQIECHPGYTQLETVEFCQKNDIVVEAWSPLGAGKLLDNKTLIKIANKYNKSVAQICLKWCLMHNILPLTRTTKKERLEENKDIYSFDLDIKDIEIIDNIEMTSWSGNHPDTLNC